MSKDLELIPRGGAADNRELPLPALDEFKTPSALVFRRNHAPAPEIDLSSWRLQVSGAVAREQAVHRPDLDDLPRTTVAATLECAGNGRALVDPPLPGLPWRNGAVSTVEWTGVRLGDVLERAGIRTDAVEVVAIGADRGKAADAPGEIPFARSLPMEKALHPDTLLADTMNGRPLTREHGFPLRLLVPGWYGMASVKWLTELRLVDRPFQGYYQTRDYVVWEPTETGPELRPITEIAVKSVITHPGEGDVAPLSGGEVRGVAWAGERTVVRVEVSTDGGATWAEAAFRDAGQPYCWRRWSWFWKPARAGQHTLMARATDDLGHTQPFRHDPHRINYMVNFTVPVPVQVR